MFINCLALHATLPIKSMPQWNANAYCVQQDVLVLERQRRATS